MSYIVALTGGIGSGKTTISNEFARLGVPIVDADMISRQIVEPGYPALSAIANHFGLSVINDDGTLNRRALRETIFNNEQEKLWLNKLLHPLIQSETLYQFAAIKAPYILWVIPLLIENNLCHYADRILVIDVIPEIQIKRTIERDNISAKLASNMLNTQICRQQRLSYANDIIDNSGEPEALTEPVAQLHQHYLQLASTKGKNQG